MLWERGGVTGRGVVNWVDLDLDLLLLRLFFL